MNRLHHIVIAALLAISTLPVHAQTYSVNYDKETVAAMVSAFGTETVAELYYSEQVSEILKHYNAAEVAAAGIFAGKFLERKALTDLGLWTSSTENYYYQRIYHMVAKKIIPKIWTVAGMMLESPQTAIYWGSYLMKVCDDVKNLCYQFESIVTNSSLSFADITFLEISEEVEDLLKLSEIGNVDWQTLLDDLGNVTVNFTKESLQADLDNLYSLGVSLASAGLTNLGEAFLQTSNFNELFSGRVSRVIDIYENYASLLTGLDNNVGKTLLNIVGGTADVSVLFNLSDYNITSWLTDYVESTTGTYYTQRWYIYRKDAGSVSLCDYYPPTDDNSIINGDAWTRFATTDASFYPSSSQREQILANSESQAGWSRSDVAALNASGDGYTYTMTYYLNAYIISRNGSQTKKAYAYEIHVKQSWNNEEEVYEDVFDSYSMDLTTFKAQLNARLSEYNDNEEGYTYYIGYDSKNYYQATDAAKLSGCETVTISVTCSDGVSLGEGSTQYKCGSCGSSVNSHTKECAMYTSVTSSSLDTSELDDMEAEANEAIASLQAQISQLEAENTLLAQKIANASVEDAATYRQQYNANLTTISELESQLAEWQQTLSDISDAKAEAEEGESEETDDYYRIPAIMQDCKTAYGLTWQSAGSWSGNSYVRTATMSNIDGIITFTATVSIARKPKYFMGIKIHRAIVQISWELTADYSNTSVVEVMVLDQNNTEEENAELVNERISEIAQTYPSCSITVQYTKTEEQEEDTSSDTNHLLWQSDRLDIAREVDSRITRIYADLVSLEKMMHYKLNIIDVLKDAYADLDEYQGRKSSIAEECRERWLYNAKHGKEDEE